MSIGTTSAGPAAKSPPSASSSRSRTARISSGCRAARSSRRPSIATSGATPLTSDPKRAFACSTSSSVATPSEASTSSGRARNASVSASRMRRTLLALPLLELDDVVVDLDGRRRLEEQAGAAGRAAVHDARDVAAMLGAHHQHVAAVALGDHLLLQVLGGVAAAHELLERARAGAAVSGAAPRGCGAAPGWPGRARRQPDRWPGGPRRLRCLKFAARATDAQRGSGTRRSPARTVAAASARPSRASRRRRAGQRVERPGRGRRGRPATLQSRRPPAAGTADCSRGTWPSRWWRCSDSATAVGVGQRLERRQRRRAQRRQRQAGDDLDDAIEFERTKCEGHVRWTRAGGRRPRSYR